MDGAAQGVRTETIRPKERDGVVQALRSGVVPRQGLRHIQVGRVGEVRQIIRDMASVADGGCIAKFVIGEYGSGKSFFLALARAIAHERKLVTAHADLTPKRRLHASQGQARNLYAELMRNMATRARPDGGALPGVVERFVAESTRMAQASGREVQAEIKERLASLQEQVAGFDFALVIQRYYEASEAGDDHRKAQCLRWLRGEFSLKTEARQELGVRSIVDDASVLDHLKLMARFVRFAGYDGLLIEMDEMVNIYKMQHAESRKDNYEQLLTIFNDAMQGTCEHMGFLFGGTPDFMMDQRRGVASYEALSSRLAENSFARNGLVDFSGPVLRLQALTREELLVLLGNLRHVFASGVPADYLVPDEALTAFMEHCSKRIGDAYFRSPRNTIKAFLNLLGVIEQNPGLTWQALLGKIEVLPDAPADAEDGEEEMADFKL